MQSFKKHIYDVLHNSYSALELQHLYYIILEKLTGLSKTKLMSYPHLELSENQTIEAKSMVKRLLNNEPIQYILGETEFSRMKFKVTSSVLIPRPETEELVEWIKTDLSPTLQQGKLLDIGTGSGCIAISLKKLFPNLNVSAMDFSTQALDIARENVKLNKVQVNFIQTDILRVDTLDKQYDVIVSNPPYIPETDKSDMLPNVLNYEPHAALFVKESDPIIFYRKIAKLAKKHLTKSGSLYFEIHHRQSENIRTMLTALQFKHIQIKTDISGNKRMIRCINI